MWSLSFVKVDEVFGDNSGESHQQRDIVAEREREKERGNKEKEERGWGENEEQKLKEGLFMYLYTNNLVVSIQTH